MASRNCLLLKWQVFEEIKMNSNNSVSKAHWSNKTQIICIILLVFK